MPSQSHAYAWKALKQLLDHGVKQMKNAKASLMVLALIAGTGVACAEDTYPKHAREYHAYLSSGVAQHLDIDGAKAEQKSGTSGRLGQGASSQFPEGPGNPQ